MELCWEEYYSCDINNDDIHQSANKFTRGFKWNLKAMHATTFEMWETNLTRMQMCYRSTSCVWVYLDYEHNVGGAYQLD